MPYLFANKEMFCDDDKDEDEDEVLAEFIAEAWRGRLLKLFPERKFIVEVIPPDPTGSVVSVGFKEVRQ